MLIKKIDSQSFTSTPKVYLAGPAVFKCNSDEIAGQLKGLCLKFGMLGLYPLDAEISDQGQGPAFLARAIREANISLIRQSDAVLADMTPFRGPGMDGGTAYEMGYAAALGLPVFAWSDAVGEYRSRVEALQMADNMKVEDFGLADNLMMAWGTADDLVHSTPQHAIDALARWLAQTHIRQMSPL
jgi:nucleoside 2-deoxyribosyltransferase